jgi:hypothetical protein
MTPWESDSPANKITVSSVPFGAQLRTLDDLLARAEKYAGSSMRNIGRLQPTIFILGIEGPQMLTADCLDSDEAKEDFARAARLLSIARSATASVMAAESWGVFAKPDESLDVTTPPSQSPHRKELIVLAGEAHGERRNKILLVLRNQTGQFAAIEELSLPKIDMVGGRFAELLSSTPASEAQRNKAEAILRAQGIVSAPRPMANRPHRFRM